MRLDKYLSEMGVGTRSELKKLIRGGGVTVDGVTVTDPGLRVEVGAEVFCRGIRIEYEEFVYYMMNKPAGVISASEDSRETTVVDLIQERRRKDLFPVGRLDRDTEGLLIITNDGALAHRLLSPAHHVDKLYRAVVAGIVTDADVRAFSEGLTLPDGLHCLPAELTILGTYPESGTSEIEVIIREGKFHQIKRMFKAVGKEVVTLKRLAMGPIGLDEQLASGEYRRLTGDEVAMLRSV